MKRMPSGGFAYLSKKKKTESLSGQASWRNVERKRFAPKSDKVSFDNFLAYKN